MSFQKIFTSVKIFKFSPIGSVSQKSLIFFSILYLEALSAKEESMTSNSPLEKMSDFLKNRCRLFINTLHGDNMDKDDYNTKKPLKTVLLRKKLQAA
jgi:hypothetical protein